MISGRLRLFLGEGSSGQHGMEMNTNFFFTCSYLPLATNALQWLSLEQQAKAPSLTFVWQ